MASMHPARIEHRDERGSTADGRDREDPAERGGVEHRRLVQVHVVVFERPKSIAIL